MFKGKDERDLMRWFLLTKWIQRSLHKNAVDHGFWEGGRNDGECIALIHSELSEVLEALRSGNPASEKAEGYSQVEEELADVLIRVFDYAEGKGFDVAGALIAKSKHNVSRPKKHGREF